MSNLPNPILTLIYGGAVKIMDPWQLWCDTCATHYPECHCESLTEPYTTPREEEPEVDIEEDPSLDETLSMLQDDDVDTDLECTMEVHPQVVNGRLVKVINLDPEN